VLALCITQYAESQRDRLTANAHFEFQVNPQDQEKIRWYLEDQCQPL
jgi:hypothetical protein